MVAVIFFGVTVALVAGLSRIISAGASRSAAPIIRQISYRFAPALPGKLVGHVFVLKNIWTRTLRCTRLEPSCVCTQGFLKNAILAPGQTTNLVLTILLGQHERKKVLGATLFGTVGGRRVEFRYIFSVTAAYPLDFSPQARVLEFGKIPLDAPRVVMAPVLVTRGALPMKWDRVTCSTDDPELRAMLTSDGANRWLLHLAYHPQKFLGHIVSHIIFTFWKDKKPLKYRMSKAVAVQISGPLYLSQPALLIGSVPRGKTVGARIAVLPADAADLPIKVLGVKYSNPSEFTSEIGGSPEQPVIRLAYTARKSFGDDTGDILITTRYAGHDYAFRVEYLAFVPQQKNVEAGR